MLRASLVLALAVPCWSATVFGPNPAGYVAPSLNGVNLNGVARVQIGGVGCSGALLADGIHVLTAAHCVDQGVVAGNISVFFETVGTLTVATLNIHPSYTGDAFVGFDLAILRLSSTVSGVTGYNLFTSGSELNQTVTISGYGESGLGATGVDSSTFPYGTRRVGENRYEVSGSSFGISNALLIGDFDDLTEAHDQLGALSASLANLGFGASEVLIAPGDSGGPSFVGGLLAGIHSFVFRIGGEGNRDIDGTLNFSFGELFADTRISSHSAWIDSITSVPEPGSFLLLAAGLSALAAKARPKA